MIMYYAVCYSKQHCQHIRNMRLNFNAKLSNIKYEIYFQNMTATRLPGKNECHVQPRSPEEPSFDLLKSSMNKVIFVIYLTLFVCLTV